MSVQVNDIRNYKKCKEKQYDAYVCMPPKNTVVINKVEQPDVVRRLGGKTFFTPRMLQAMKMKNQDMYGFVCGLMQKGIVQATGKGLEVVVAGTLGELQCMSLGALARKYVFMQNGKKVAIGKESFGKLIKNEQVNWTTITSVPAEADYVACFVPREQSGMMTTSSGRNTAYNAPSINHGKGDFIVMPFAGNGPDYNRVEIVNGLIFAKTFNNMGWTQYLDTQTADKFNITLDKLPKIIEAPVGESKPRERVKVENPNSDEGMLATIYNMMKPFEAVSVREMPFTVTMADGYILAKAQVIESYKNENSIKKGEKVTQVKEFETHISVKDGNIKIDCLNVYPNGQKKLAYKVGLPKGQNGLEQLQKNLQLYVGLMGFIPNGAQNKFQYAKKPSKYEYDGIEAYTISSSGINRKLRLQDYKDEKEEHDRQYEREGLESQRLYRAIDGTDRYFDGVQLIDGVQVFRGMPGCDARKFSGSKTFEEMPGHVITNTAYTSSTLNMHSSLMFARTKDDPTDGVVLAIQLPPGMHADYIHNIAGWKEQFEILWDRKYDIKVGEEKFRIAGAGNFTYHVFLAEIVEHTPMGKIPSYISTSHHQNVPNIDYYDVNGRINFDYELIKGIIKESFNFLKKAGVTGLQYQEKFRHDPAQRDFIVAHLEKEKGKPVKDLMFTYNNESRLLDIFQCTCNNPDVARNYWSDWNRNAGALDRNFSWETYNGNAIDENGMELIPKTSIDVAGGVDNPEEVAKHIASTIMDYLEYNKDCTPFPLQDIARYFDTVFKCTIVSEGYELKDSKPVNRTGDPNNENDGYVDMQYLIDGDDDDSLMILMRLKKNKDGKLIMAYRGRSMSKKVDEQKALRWDIFNQDVMEQTCGDILYTFAKKLNLNHTRKITQLMDYIGKRMCMFVAVVNENLSGMNIHQQGNHKAYTLMTSNRQYAMRNTCDVARKVATCDLIDSARKHASGQIPTDMSIMEMYKMFIDIGSQLV